jgi:16S rRNA (cytidine1402-2'-O)-methyltransferase
MESTEGTLTLVATPIGNLGDWSPRAIEAVCSADIIACEDTRVSRKLLNHKELQVDAEWISYREETEHVLADTLSEKIAQGAQVVLMADAGTPAISDPGFRLVRACRSRGLKVTATPGPNAAIVALSVSGLPSDRFLFAGFLPPKKAARIRFFSEQLNAGHTIILYESCHRILKCLEDALEILGPDRCVCVARELTKLHETITTGSLGTVLPIIKKSSQKGEFVVLIAKLGYTLNP